MSFFEFPHTRTYDSDLGWIIERLKENIDRVAILQAWAAVHKTEYDELKEKVDALVDGLVDVISPWDSSREYTVFDIVEYQGVNYIAVKDVPVGAMITNTEYWQPANTVVEQINAMGTIVSDLQNEKFYYNVADFDILPDTGTDLYEQLFYLFKDVETAGGGIIYFPKGKYIISDCLFIPANTCVVGDGAASEIYYTEEYHQYGTGISNGGDNVGIFNIKVSHANTGDITEGDMAGAIGISDFDTTNVINPHDFVNERVSNRSGVTIMNVYSEGRYALQTEPSVHIDSVFVDGVFAPNAKVSVNGTIDTKNLSYKNIKCSYFRFYAASNTSVISADTVECDNAFIGARAYSKCIIRNMYVHAVQNKIPTFITDAPLVIDGSAELYNITVLDELEYNYSIYKKDRNYHVYYNNVTVSGSKQAYYCEQGLDAITRNYDIFNACYFSQTETTDTYLYGRFTDMELSSGIHMLTARPRDFIGTAPWSATASSASNTPLTQDVELYYGTYMFMVKSPLFSSAMPISLEITDGSVTRRELIGTVPANTYASLIHISNILDGLNWYKANVRLVTSGSASITITGTTNAGLQILRL